MSKISYIHGLGASSVPADEWAQRGKEVPGRQFIPYMNMTSGQMKLALLEEQLRILAGYYPEHRSELLPAITKLENTLHAGVHGIGLLPRE